MAVWHPAVWLGRVAQGAAIAGLGMAGQGRTLRLKGHQRYHLLQQLLLQLASASLLAHESGGVYLGFETDRLYWSAADPLDRCASTSS